MNILTGKIEQCAKDIIAQINEQILTDKIYNDFEEEIYNDDMSDEEIEIIKLLVWKEIKNSIPIATDAEDDSVYQLTVAFEDIINNAPEHVQKFYRELSSDRQQEFIKKNMGGARSGFDFGLADPLYDVKSTIGSCLESDDDVVLEHLSEPLVDDKGLPTTCKVIEMRLNIDEYIVSFSKHGHVVEEVFDNEEDADEYFATLAKEHPECKNTSIF